jgi:hypothetical protein
MPVRGAQPKRIIPSGVSDAPEGSLAFPGAMAQLGNLVPLPNAKGIFAARPAMAPIAALPDCAGQGTALEGVGNTFYGMKPSVAYPGYDTPFLYTGSAFTPITGITQALLPATQPTSGDWTPPTIAQVGGRVIFTHPGFPGGNTQIPTYAGFEGNFTLGSPQLLVGVNVGNFQPPSGAVIYNGNVPAGTTVVDVAHVAGSVTASWSANSNTISVNSTAGLWVGMRMSGPGIGAAITAIGSDQVTVNNAPTAEGSSVVVGVYGIQIAMSQEATATATGFVGIVSAVAVKFGWLDISGFSTSIAGNLRSGIPLVTGGFDITGIAPGMNISGPGLPAGTTVLQVTEVNFVARCDLGPYGDTSTGVSLIDTFGEAEPAQGQTVSGSGISADTTVQNYNNSTQNIVLSDPATASGFASLTFSGAVIVLSQAPTSAEAQATFTITGGTPAAPLWGAGDLNITPIASTTPPVFVSQFAGRAYYGVNVSTTSPSAGVQASDAGSPSTQTFASQTLLFENGVPVTAAAGLPLFNQLGGIIQSLIVFQSDTNIQQITGDFSANDIGVNTLNVATGTLSPNSIASSQRGLLFAASDGLRLIDFDGQVSDPLGEHGQGLIVPFINAVTPTRTSASFNENVYRLTVTWLPPPSTQAVWGTVERTDEFWFHLAEQGRPLQDSRWSGPHTSTQVLSQPWPQNASFLCIPAGAPTQLYRSDPKPLASSGYVEFDSQLQCLYQTLLTPDNPDGFARAAVETTVWIALVSGSEEILATAIDDFGQTLDETYVVVGPFSTAAQRAIAWHTNLVFRQMALSLAAAATPQLQLGAIVLRTKGLGYQLPYPVPQSFILSQDNLGGQGALGP